MDLYPSGYWMMIAEPQGMLQRGLSHPLQNENGAVLWSARAATTSLSLPLFSLTSLDDNTSLYHSVQNTATFPVLLLKSSKKVVFLNKISSK